MATYDAMLELFKTLVNKCSLPAKEYELVECAAKTEDLIARIMRSIANLIPPPTVKTMLNWKATGQITQAGRLKNLPA